MKAKVKFALIVMLVAVTIPLTSHREVIGAQKRIQFGRGQTSTTVSGTTSKNQSQSYLLRVTAGQTMELFVSPLDKKSTVYFQVYEAQSKVPLWWKFGVSWKYDIPITGDYLITVYTDNEAQTQFSLEISIPPGPQKMSTPLEGEIRQSQLQKLKEEIESKIKLGSPQEGKREFVESKPQEIMKQEKQSHEEAMDSFLKSQEIVNYKGYHKQFGAPILYSGIYKNPFAFKNKVIGAYGILKKMLSPTEGVFVDQGPFDSHPAPVDSWEIFVVSDLPRGFISDWTVIVIGRVLDTKTLINMYGVKFEALHIKYIGSCASVQDGTTCR